MRIYDISQEIFSCNVYTGDPKPEKTVLYSTEAGDLYNLTAFSMCAHNGTHIDAPYHFLGSGDTVDRMELTVFVGDCYVARHTGDVSASDAKRILSEAKDAERIRVAGQLAQYVERERTLLLQQKILNARRDDLIIRSPIDGTVMTFDLENKLRSRPVQPGQILLEVAKPEEGLILELQMPEKRMGHIDGYFRKLRESDPEAALSAKFVMMVDPAKHYGATVVEEHDRAENRGTEETTVQMRATIDDPESLPEGTRAGAGVSAKVYCGKRPLGYVCFNELVAFLQKTVLFWFE